MHLPKPSYKKVAFAGELVIDKNRRLGQRPTKGNNLMKSYQEVLGGCAPNGALGARSVGATARLIGHRGDEDAPLFVKALTDRRIDTTHMTVRGKTAFSDIVEWPSDSKGRSFERQQMFYGGDAWTLAPSDLIAPDQSEDVLPPSLEGVGVLVLNAHHLVKESTEAWVLKLAELSHRFGIRIVMDMSSTIGLEKYAKRYRESDKEPMRRVVINRVVSLVKPDVVVMNADEWRFLGGNGSASDIIKYVDATVVHRGSEPTLVFDRYGDRFEVPVEPVEVVREIGAGDAFIGGLAGAWSRGHTEVKALVESAHAAAAEWVTTPAIEPSTARSRAALPSLETLAG